MAFDLGSSVRIKGVNACPYCGNDDAFYVMHTASGKTAFFYGFDGSDADNTHLWDAVKLKPQRTAFCGECQKNLGPIED